MITTDLGYVTNAGWSKKWGFHKKEDDRFAVEIEIIPSDHKLNTMNAVHNLHLAMSYGKTVVVASQPIKIVGKASNTVDRKANERAYLKFEQVDPFDYSIPYLAK